MTDRDEVTLFTLDKPIIKGFPELRWTGKRPYNSTQYYPAQLKESYGDKDDSGWINKIFWGDNLQVMSHLLKEYRGKIKLIYIDPPFDSKADYKKKIKIKGITAYNDNSTFEEKQYGDIWTNDEYLQFMYERLILMKELLSDDGVIYLHCDYHKSHHLRCLLDEIFGPSNFINEVIWHYHTGMRVKSYWNRKHDTIFMYGKTQKFQFNFQMETRIYPYKPGMASDGGAVIEEILNKDGIPTGIYKSQLLSRDVWDISQVFNMSNEYAAYPTQKPEELLNKIILASSNPGDIVFDCFMGSGTTQAVALKNNRHFIGSDINLGAVQTTTKRLLNILKGNERKGLLEERITGFEVYNVNNYEFFRNPVQARDLLIEALDIQKYSSSHVFDGELDGRNVKILPVNRIATKADLNELVANLPYKAYEKMRDENPKEFVDRITLVCMGHEPDLASVFKQMVGSFNIDVDVVDILKDKTCFEFKRDSQANIVVKHNEVIIKDFYPMNLLQKLSIQKENVDDWTQLVDSIMIDYNFNGETLTPQIVDVPDKKDVVKGKYKIPNDHGRIKVKITDLLSESLEIEVN